MQFTGTFEAPRLNFQRYQNALEEELGHQLGQAIRLWLGAVTNIVPVWSGASHGTFLKLASEIGFDLTPTPSGAKVRNRVNLGFSNSEGQINTDEFSKGVVTFTYATTLRHLIYNEFNNANVTPDPGLFSRLIHEGPYHFQEKGLAVFKKFAATVRLPSPFNSLDVKQIKVG
jgi:hypothetical protein